jgi:trk system potassium uptake protein TrkA
MVVGGGRLGYYLSRALLNEGHEVLVLEKNASICEGICRDMGSICMRGDGCEIATLEKAGTARADMFISVTGDDEDNLVACQVAKYQFKVPRTIARIRNPKNEAIFKKLGIDVTVSSTSIILEHIEHEVPSHRLTHLLSLQDRGLVIVEISIPQGAETVGRSLRDFNLPQDNLVSLVMRKGEKPFLPNKDTIIEADDHLLAITSPETEESLRTMLIGS